MVTPRKHRQPEICHDALTEEERAYVLDRLQSGHYVRAQIVRKLLRLSDNRLRRIQELEEHRARPAD